MIRRPSGAPPCRHSAPQDTDAPTPAAPVQLPPDIRANRDDIITERRILADWPALRIRPRCKLPGPGETIRARTAELISIDHDRGQITLIPRYWDDLAPVAADELRPRLGPATPVPHGLPAAPASHRLPPKLPRIRLGKPTRRNLRSVSFGAGAQPVAAAGPRSPGLVRACYSATMGTSLGEVSQMVRHGPRDT